jgi:hypothetical protein
MRHRRAGAVREEEGVGGGFGAVVEVVHVREIENGKLKIEKSLSRNAAFNFQFSIFNSQ